MKKSTNRPDKKRPVAGKPAKGTRGTKERGGLKSRVAKSAAKFTGKAADEARPAAARKPGERPAKFEGRGAKPGERGGVVARGRGEGRWREAPKPVLKPQADPNGPMRLNRFISQAGICSRREADVLIETGVVTVNGEIVTELGTRVLTSDTVQVGGDGIRPDTKRYVLLNKPKNFTADLVDTRGRRTIMDLVKSACKENLFPIGKTDRDMTGLVVLTNDGEFADRIMHPKLGLGLLHHVVTNEKVNKDHLETMMKGFTLEDAYVKAEDATISETNPYEVGVTIRSNRSRIVRRMFEHFGYRVVKIDRVVYGPLTKKNLARGQWRHLTQEELNILRMAR